MIKKKGFTLIELSIVLVIIGLLIGGILVGQSIIDSAKINKELSRLGQYAIAVVQFKQKFKQEAGDTILFSNPAGNNNGTNDISGACPTRAWEPFSAWSHLSRSGMLTDEIFVWVANPTPPCSAIYIGATPTNKMNANGSALPYSYNYTISGSTFGGKKYQRYFGAYYDPEILWGLENKLDDGVPSSSTGQISSLVFSNPFPVCTPANIAATPNASRYCLTTIYFNDTLN